MKNNFKKTAALILTGALLLSTGVYADEVVTTEILPRFTENVLTVSDVGNDYITAYEGENKDTAIMLKINNDTAVIDSVTAMATDTKEIKSGDTVLCEYSSAMTRSIPPQANAYLIATNTEKGGNVNLINADTAETDENGNIVVTDNTKNIIVTVLKDAEISPYKTKNIVTLADIKAGNKMLMWYDAVALSFPAQASTDKVVLLAEESNEIDIETTDIDGKQFVPVRTAFENLGYEVTWNDADKSVTISKDVCITVAIGSDKAMIDDAEVSTGAATVLKDGKTLVAAEFFTAVTGKTISVK